MSKLHAGRGVSRATRGTSSWDEARNRLCELRDEPAFREWWRLTVSLGIDPTTFAVVLAEYDGRPLSAQAVATPPAGLAKTTDGAGRVVPLARNEGEARPGRLVTLGSAHGHEVDALDSYDITGRDQGIDEGQASARPVGDRRWGGREEAQSGDPARVRAAR